MPLKNTSAKKKNDLSTAKRVQLEVAKPIQLLKSKKKLSKADDQILVDFIHNAHKGEKKTESGIKYWFEQTIPGHQTEDREGSGAPDGYSPGWLVLELKGKQEDWLEAFFQGLSRKELSFKKLVVACHNRLLVFPGPRSSDENWDEQKLQEWKSVVKECQSFDESANRIGKKLASKYRGKGHLFFRFAQFQWAPISEGTLIGASQSEEEAIQNFKHLITSFDTSKARVEITPKNFSKILKSFLPFFDPKLEKQFEVVHGFFRSMSYWNSRHSAILSEDPAELDRVFIGAGYFEGLLIDAREDFITALQQYEVIETDKSKFYAHYDRAIDAVDPDYRENHGIYFTNEYLARLAITLSEEYLGSISDKYIVFDPACGSGNLVTSWNHHLDLRHKVVSEISPILLKAFEMRFQGKSSERRKGFTIIPKTSTGEGLNFVSESAGKYLEKINKELQISGHKLNKPLAIVCNPPYKNQKDIKDAFYKYDIDQSIIDIVDGEASKELFVCFLAQITEICRVAEENDFPPNSVVLLFTQSGWLTSKSSYDKIRNHFLERFNFKHGFIANSSEFFDGTKSWPLVVSLWEFSPKKKLDPKRELKFRNFFNLTRQNLKELIGDKHTDFDDLSNWGTDQLFLKRLEKTLREKESAPMSFNRKIKKIKELMPTQAGDGNLEISQDLISKNLIMGGLCFATDEQMKSRKDKFKERVLPVYEENKRKKNRGEKTTKLPSFKVVGNPFGKFIGFTEGKQPFRTNKEFSNNGTNLFFLMDTRFHKMNTSQCFSGIPTTRGHVIRDLDSEGRMLLMAFSMAHSLTGHVPSQFNQYDMWAPEGSQDQMNTLFELSCAFVYINNSCIECEIPKDHPADGLERVFVVNPLSPNKGTFWNSKLLPLVKTTNIDSAKEAIKAVDNLYAGWQKWLTDHTAYRAKADLPIYQHSNNKLPGDGWGIYQIEQEIKLLPREQGLQKLVFNRKAALKNIKQAIQDHLEKMGYWNC